jgi:hypothetical protein
MDRRWLDVGMNTYRQKSPDACAAVRGLVDPASRALPAPITRAGLA